MSSAENLERRRSDLPTAELHQIADAERCVADTYRASGRSSEALLWEHRPADTQ